MTGIYDNGSKLLGVKRDIMSYISKLIAEEILDEEWTEFYAQLLDEIKFYTNFEDTDILCVNYDLPNDLIEISAWSEDTLIYKNE